MLPHPRRPPGPLVLGVLADWRGPAAHSTVASVELLEAAPEARRLLFDPDAAGGARLSWLRLPLTATDMSREPWTLGWDGAEASPGLEAEAAIVMTASLERLQPHSRWWRARGPRLCG